MDRVENCLLCGVKDVKNIQDPRDVAHFECPNCKEVLISRTAIVTMQKHKEKYWLLSAYFRRQSKRQLSIEMLNTDNFDELTSKVSRPSNINETRIRIIEFFGNNSDLMGSFIKYDPFMYLDIIVQKTELEYVIYSLCQQDILETNYEPMFLEGGYNFDLIRLSPEGWDHYEEIKTTPLDSNKVFIAMWFNEETERIRESIKSAILSSGYEAIIVDERHFTGNIMDFVISQIKESKFLIADFTVSPEEQTEIDPKMSDEVNDNHIRNGTRGGVYYEAGYAKGIGLKVIHTCKNNKISKNRLHFDIAQDNTLFWTNDDLKEIEVRNDTERLKNPTPINFTEKLYDRIISIFGYGKNYFKI